MVFCCIAICGFAITYFSFLSVRHLFSGPRRDRASDLPVPPRALTGNQAQPVFGHTFLFAKSGGDIALRFPEHWNEWKWLPAFLSRRLGKIFSVFVWGRWRVVVRGPDRVQKVLDSSDIQEGWAWSPPLTLLGKSCMPLLRDEERDFLGSMLASPLSQTNVLKLAPEFGEAAEKFVDHLLTGKFKKELSGDDLEECGDPCHHCTYKIKYNTLRSYTFDLIEGPVMRWDKWKKENEQTKGEGSAEGTKNPPANDDDDDGPDRSTMILWMDRLKRGLCSIKLTFGTEWMHMWRLNEYGRALNARMHLEEEVRAHIEERARLFPTERFPGYIFRDPWAMPFPVITLAENVLRRNETVIGTTCPEPRKRFRSNSEPNLDGSGRGASGRGASGRGSLEDWTQPDRSGRQRSNSSPNVIQSERFQRKPNASSQAKSILDRLLRQEDNNGRGLTHAVITELSILIWMIMDAGNAWTAMALHLLALDKSACVRVQKELDELVETHGWDGLFAPKVLGEMKTLDALLYEAIRLCPPFLGGMKVVSDTIELEEAGVQIPKDSNVVFCQPTIDAFDLSNAIGKLPQQLGFYYPCPELHGFLPMQGLEVPLMVLQSKVFISVLLLRCSPFLSRKTTFIRKIQQALSTRKEKDTGERTVPTPSLDEEDDIEAGSVVSMAASATNTLEITGVPGSVWDMNKTLGDTTQTAAMKLFSKIPFPEPHRVLNVCARDVASAVF